MAETRREIETALGASFIFPVLGQSERETFIASARPRSFRAGEPIFHMGDPGDSMMLVETGEVRISYPAPDGRAVVLSELKPGAVFGEIALLDGGQRSADATASTNCTLLVFERRAADGDAAGELAARRGRAQARLRPAPPLGRAHGRPRLLGPARPAREDACRRAPSPRPAAGRRG